MADERYTQLELYPWDAGVPRDWPQQGYIGPSTYKLPAWRLGADTASGGSSILPLLFIGGAIFLFLKLNKGSGGPGRSSNLSAPSMRGIIKGDKYDIDYSKSEMNLGGKSYVTYTDGYSSYQIRGPESKISRLPEKTRDLPGVIRKLGL